MNEVETTLPKGDVDLFQTQAILFKLCSLGKLTTPVTKAIKTAGFK